MAGEGNRSTGEGSPGCNREDAEEIATLTRRFSLLEITSGLPDDSREEEEREAERRLRELRGRVKAARAVVTTTPGLADVIVNDWRRAAAFYARCGITQVQFRYVVPGVEVLEDADLGGAVRSSGDLVAEVRSSGDLVAEVRSSGDLVAEVRTREEAAFQGLESHGGFPALWSGLAKESEHAEARWEYQRC